MPHVSIVDHRKLVRALNARHGPGSFRSVPLGLGDVRTVQRHDGFRWEDVADTDDTGELRGLMRDWLPETYHDPSPQAWMRADI
jgi:hypothetical protein